MRVFGLFISNRPQVCARSMRLFKFDKYIAFVHKNQAQAFREAFAASECLRGIEIDIVTHNHGRRKDGQPPLGAIRHDAFDYVQSKMRRNDIAWMADDDAKVIRWAKPGATYNDEPGAPQSYRTASPRVFYRELVRVAVRARKYGFDFFTHNYNARSHNSYNPRRPFQARGSWNGFVGFAAGAPNPFDPFMGDGEDYDAAYRMVRENSTLPILRHNGLTIEFDFISDKYYNGLRANRVVARYSDIAKVSTNCITGVPYPRIRRDVENQLRLTVPARVR